MHIPSKDIVKFMMKEALKKRKARSQQEFTKTLIGKLRSGDNAYSVSERRVRLLALGMPEIRVRVYTKKGPVPAKCPSCDNRLRKAYMKNLLSRLDCPRCGYSGNDGRWAPLRYEFELRE
jgi:predicted RNA-binding Zn-ribbon protein involved in translation (DUF1610 family)